MGQTALALVGSDLIKQPLTVITCVIALLNLDARFTLISLTLFPLCMVPVAIYGKRIRKNGRQEEEQAGAMTVILTETFAGIRVIKSFARENHQVEQFDEANMRQFYNAIRVRKATEIVSPMVEVIAALGVGLALFYVHTPRHGPEQVHQPDGRALPALQSDQADQPDAHANPEVPGGARASSSCCSS